ncbi:MAG: LruC domain-containing protein [Bacteroidia bacterium]|nr:LruC domain-containing protein [Bacteroidia bacterium]
MKNINYKKMPSLFKKIGCLGCLCLLLLINAPTSSAQCTLSVHSNQTKFNNSSSGVTPTSLWVNIHVNLNGELTANGDVLYYTGGTVTLTNISSTPAVTNAAIPTGKIIADNTVTTPVTIYDGLMWLTRVPLNYVNTDIFISGAIINSSTGFSNSSGQKSSSISGYLYSNKTVSKTWFYGMATYAPQFTYSNIATSNQVIPVTGTYNAGTPTTQISNLKSGGSGDGGNNYTGDYSDKDDFVACACPAPVLAAITGGLSVCANLTTQLSNTTTGGIWSSSNILVASISTTGLVTAIAAGTSTITYRVTNNCSVSSSVTATVTVITRPSLGVITGSSLVCVGSTLTLADTTAGGTWASANTTVASVSTSGVVTGVAAGTIDISYSKTNSCGTISVYKTITVNSIPTVSAISGSSSLCTNSTITLTNATIGGVWSSNNTVVGTVNSAGVVTGVATGGVTIRYAVTNTCGTTTVTKGLTVNTQLTVPDITGSSTVNTAFTTTLSNSVTGGIWSSSNTAVATAGITGIVTGVSVGTAAISYAVTSTCGTATKTKMMTVSNRAPVATNDTAATLNNTPVNISVLNNDVAGSGAFVNSSLIFVSGTIPSTNSVGTFVANSNGSVTFTPVSSFHAVATIQYRITDGLNQSATAYIIITVAAPLIIDTDNDGAPDAIDEYPSDPYRAFNNYYPSSGYSSLLFEDNWPDKGDYDFNDLVVDYKYNTVTNASNNVVEIKYNFITKCAGAGLHNGFAFQLDNVAPNKITRVTGAKTHNANWVSNSANGTESGQTYTNVIVFDNAYNILTYPGSGHFVNTDMLAPKTPYDTTFIQVTFINAGVAPAGGSMSLNNVPATAFNPYIILGDSGSFNQNRSKEVHMPDRVPSSKMSNAFWGKGNDNSNPATGRYYRTSNNLPWVLNVSTAIPYMQEYLDISSGYLNFLSWAVSNGTSNTNWYLNLTGNRDNSKIYTK